MREMFWDVSVDSLLSPALEIKFPRNAHGEIWLRLYQVAASDSIFRPLDFEFKVSQEVFVNHVVYAARLSITLWAETSKSFCR